MATAPAEQARLLLALDACGVAAEMVERAVAMAAGLDAELAGLFIENEALLRAAALPFASEVRVSGHEQRWNAETLVEATRRASADAARLIEHHAAARRVRWSFATATGARLSAALAAGEGADLLLPPRRPGPRQVEPRRPPLLRVSLLYDASSQTDRALRVVRALAANGHTRELRLFTGRHLAPRSLAALGAPRLEVRVEHADTGDAAALLRAMTSATAGGLTILPRRLLALAPADADLVLETLPGALLLLR